MVLAVARRPPHGTLRAVTNAEIAAQLRAMVGSAAPARDVLLAAARRLEESVHVRPAPYNGHTRICQPLVALEVNEECTLAGVHPESIRVLVRREALKLERQFSVHMVGRDAVVRRVA